MSGIRYPHEFKLEALRQITNRGYRLSDVSRRLGVAPKTLRMWIKQYGSSGSSPQALTDQQAEIRKPKAEFRCVTEDRDILDNGPDLMSARFTDWCEANGINVVYIQPGKPHQNGFIERFNGSFRRGFLDAYLFESISQVRDMAWFWRMDYNEERPHESLGNLPHAIYRAKLEISNLQLSQ